MPPLICRDGAHVRVHVEGVPLGLLDDREYEEVEVETKPGDLILLYSDGLEDQPDAADEPYGQQRLFRTLKKHCAEPPEAIVEAIFRDIDAFKGEAPAFGDQTMLAIKVTA